MLLAMAMTQGWRVSVGGVAAVALAAGLTARPAAADEIQLSMDAGRVTLVASGAPLTDVLAAWSRVGGTRFVDAEAVAGESVTLRLVDVTESEALRVLLRPAVGYVAAPRRPGSTGISRYDRVKLLGTGRLAPATAAAGGGRAVGDGQAGAGTPTAAPMPLEDMQRLLNAVSGTTGGVAAAVAAAPGEAGSAPSGADDAGAARPAPTTPFPGMVVEPGQP